MTRRGKSRVTEYGERSIFRGISGGCRHQLIFGSGLRKLADEDGLWIPLTNSEHNMSHEGRLYQIHDNPTAEKLSKIAGQLAWEKHAVIEYGYNDQEVREAFINRYGISYL